LTYGTFALFYWLFKLKTAKVRHFQLLALILKNKKQEVLVFEAFGTL